MARKSKLEIALEGYSPIIENSFLTPKFEYTSKDLVFDSLETKVQQVVFSTYLTLIHKVLASKELTGYSPSYDVRYNAARKVAINSKNKILSTLTARSKTDKGIKPSSKVPESEF